MKIMIVDDNDFSVELLSSMIDDASIEIQIARDGSEAVQIFENSVPGEYSMILMDIVMNYENGDHAVKRIRSLNREDAKTVRIYASTALVNYDMSDFDGILSKPFDRKKVNEIIRSNSCK